MTPEEPHVLLSLAYLASHYICFKIQANQMLHRLNHEWSMLEW